MKRFLIINATPRNAVGVDVVIPRKNYECKVPAESSCYKIQKYLISDIDECEEYVDCVNLKGIQPCTACYACVKSGICCKCDVMTHIYENLDHSTDLIIISPLYYGTIPSQLLAFFSRLYPYWINSYNLNPKTGFPNFYPKLNVVTIGTCADPWQDWTLFDLTLNSIYKEIGWVNKGVYHLPNFTGTESELNVINNIKNEIFCGFV